MSQTNTNKWLRWRWSLAGSGIGVIFAGVAVILMFLLPASLPVIGVFISVFAAWTGNLGALLSGIAIIGGIFGMGIVSGIISKAAQWSINKIAKAITIKKAFNATSSKLIDHSSALHPLKSSHRALMSLFGTTSYEENEDTDIEDDFNSDERLDNINALLTDICTVNLKEAGWQQKIVAIRERLKGHEEEMIEAIQHHGDKLLRQIKQNIAREKADDIASILKDGFIKKVYIVCHPDKWQNPYAAAVLTALQNWVDNAKTQLEEIILLSEYTKKQDMVLRHMDECIRHMDEYIKEADDFLIRADESLREVAAGMKKAEKDLEKVEKDTKEIRSDVRFVTEERIAIASSISELKADMRMLNTNFQKRMLGSTVDQQQPEEPQGEHDAPCDTYRSRSLSKTASS